MLVPDKSKMVYLSPNTGAPFAQFRAYKTGNGGYSQMGCGGQCSQLGALGDVQSLIEKANQFNPEPISNAAINFMTKISNFFGIGAGRMEADQIVPIQNEVVDAVIAPIAYAVNADFKDYLSVSQLQAMLDALLNAKDAWLNFLHNTEWSDGRAATQAEATLAPYFDDQQRKIMALLPNAPSVNYQGGEGGVVPVIQGVPLLGLPPVRLPTSGGSFTGVLQQYAPYLLLGAIVFALPKIGKWQGKSA